MRPTTLKELEWIHDCVVSNIVYDASASFGRRALRISMKCPVDLGYEPWGGKSMALVASDVAAFTQSVWGVVAEAETINAIRPGVSAAFQNSTTPWRSMGARFPELEFTVSFHSGSALEVICESLQVIVDA
jgi:hypothetical protein